MDKSNSGTVLTDFLQYFSMPLTFLQECEDSAGMGQESTGMGLESTRIHRNETGFHRNYCIPAGIELESAGMEYIE